MALGRPDTVEEWAPVFLFYAGSGAPKYTKEQALDIKFAISFGHCKLCDWKVEGSPTEHMKAHRKELTTWLAKRRQSAEQNKKKGLATWRKEQELAAKAQASAIIEQVGAEADEED